MLGVQSQWALDWRKKGKHPLDAVGSLADGIAVKEPGELTEPIINRYVDELVAVSEEDIARGVLTFLKLEKTLVEGAGAVGLSALMSDKLPKKVQTPLVGGLW